jgi:hypothetical protein
MKRLRTADLVGRTNLMAFGAMIMTLWAAPAAAIRNGDPDPGAVYGAVGQILPSATHAACTGTLIYQDLVLTAAQCVDDKSASPVFEFSPAPGRTARATAILQHPGFDLGDGLNLTYDVALIRLDRATTSSWTDIVPLWIASAEIPTLVPATEVGFGETSTGVGSGTRRSGAMLVTQYIGGDGAQGVVVPDAFLEAVPGNDMNQMFCPGDAGGPLLYQGQIAGIASFRSVATCDESGPGYYVPTGRLAQWIGENAKMLEAAPPWAYAGADQSVHAGQTVVLDGTLSHDSLLPSQPLNYAWALSSKPAASAASLTGATTATPAFVADVVGDYIVSLTVRDANGLASFAATVLIHALNAPPTANAGPDQSGVAGQLVTLDGSGSSDPDGDAMTFLWTLAAPAGSTAGLAGATTSHPTFTSDLPGTYTATLTVSDGRGGVGTDSVVVSVVSATAFAEQQAASALDAVRALPSASVTNRIDQRLLEDVIAQAISALHAGHSRLARGLLELAVSRMDGCALRSTPDMRGIEQDWLTSCAAQAVPYAKLKAAIGALGA